MITILSTRDAAELFRRLREYHGMSKRDLGDLLWVDSRTIYDRDNHRTGITTDALIATARVFGFDVALIPRPHPHPTGTGWPGETA